MAFTDASALLTQLQTQIAACAGWSGGSSAVHYPELAWGSGPTFPCALVSEESRSNVYYAAGAAGLRNGSLKLTIYAGSATTLGALETLGQTILEQLLAQQSGIPFRDGEVGMAGDATDASIAAATEVRGVEVTLNYGLSA